MKAQFDLDLSDMEGVKPIKYSTYFSVAINKINREKCLVLVCPKCVIYIDNDGSVNWSDDMEWFWEDYLLLPSYTPEELTLTLRNDQ